MSVRTPVVCSTCSLVPCSLVGGESSITGLTQVPAVAPWTSNLNNTNIVDANSSLAAFEAFLGSQGGVIAGIPYDHAMLITGYVVDKLGLTGTYMVM